LYYLIVGVAVQLMNMKCSALILKKDVAKDLRSKKKKEFGVNNEKVKL